MWTNLIVKRDDISGAVQFFRCDKIMSLGKTRTGLFHAALNAATHQA
jgi:hypothetical protein